MTATSSHINSSSKNSSHVKKILLLGSGELGRELTISLKRLGCTVIAVDNYHNAPAHQVADQFEVIDMLNGEALAQIVYRHQPDLIVPEVEAIRTEKLLELEKENFEVIPNANAAFLTMNRIAIREMAAQKLKLRTARYAYASSEQELREKILSEIKLPCVVKPVMSSSGKGQSTLRTEEDIVKSWTYACEGMRGDIKKVIVEEFIQFESEITLLTIRTRDQQTLFVKPIGHRQERGDFQESWLPARISEQQLAQAQDMAQKVTTALGGYGLFGVEFFLTKDEVIFSELSPRPHDTGMVTLISQDLSEFDLHARAILGLPIPEIQYQTPAAACAVILASQNSTDYKIHGVSQALSQKGIDVRLFQKPSTRPYRRMGIVLARGENIESCKQKAIHAAQEIHIEYGTHANISVEPS
jgi:phosphoribosylglycinamide formyltransferase 2